MFGLSSIKLIGIALGALFIVGVVFAGYRYVENLQDRAIVAEKNEATAKAAFAVSDASLKVATAQNADLTKRLAESEEMRRQINAAYDDSQKEVASQRAKFARHNLDKDATANAKWIEALSNRATCAAWQRMRAAAGYAPADNRNGSKAAADHPSATGPTAQPACTAKLWHVGAKGSSLPVTSWCVDARGYEALADIWAEITRFLRDRSAELAYYRNLK